MFGPFRQVRAEYARRVPFGAVSRRGGRQAKPLRVLVGLAMLCAAWHVGSQGSAAQDAQGARVQVAGRAGEAMVRELGGRRLAAGSALRVEDKWAGDLFAAGGSVELLAPVGGDAFAAAGSVRASGGVAHDAYLVGGHVSLAGTTGRNLRVAAGRVDLARTASVGRNASLAGGRVEVLGNVGGALQVAAGRVLIDARVEGDVDVAAGDVELGPNARIGGRLAYASTSEIKRDPSARVNGSVERRGALAPGPDGAGDSDALFGFAALLWSAGVALPALVLLLGFPGPMGRSAACARQAFGGSLAIGVATLAGLPLLALVAAVTIVGLPVALLLVLAYPLLLMLGYACGLIALSDAFVARARPDRAGHLAWRVVSLLLVVALLLVLGRMPVVGLVIGLLVLATGVGALLRVSRGAGIVPARSARETGRRPSG